MVLSRWDSPHFINEINAKDYNVIGVNVSLAGLWDCPAKKEETGPFYTSNATYYGQDLEIHYSIKGSFLLSDILTDRHSVGRS